MSTVDYEEVKPEDLPDVRRENFSKQLHVRQIAGNLPAPRKLFLVHRKERLQDDSVEDTYYLKLSAQQYHALGGEDVSDLED